MENLLRGRDSKEQRLTRWKAHLFLECHPAQTWCLLSFSILPLQASPYKVYKPRNGDWKSARLPCPLQIPWTPASSHILARVFVHIFLLCFFFCFPQNSTDTFLQIIHILASIAIANHCFPPQFPYPFQCLEVKVELSSLAWWYYFSMLLLSLRLYTLGFNLGSAYFEQVA